MAKSLLAHLYTHIKGSQEDIATISLQYILSQSDELNRAFIHCLSSSLEIGLDDDLQFVCQPVGEHKDRPDMAGLDVKGKEQILCEMKFYAGLTQNQPLAYIDRLQRCKGKGLIFICPTRRQQTLWVKLKESCANRIVRNISDYCIDVDGIRMALTTWSDILERLTKVSASVAVEYLADIRQLEGFCSQLDCEAFVPFTDRDLSAEIALKADRYYQVIDKTVELLHGDDSLKTSLKGVKATAYRKGYTRSMYVDEFTLTINYDRDLWKSDSTVDTPFWVAIRDSKWIQTENMVQFWKEYPLHLRTNALWSMYFLALIPPVGLPIMEVCEELKQQILEYINAYRSNEVR